ncbi:MAG: DnaD domain protein [Tissierellia bacterium]|nr:DnaD domain protein [Tissierellia bacterium]
MKYKIENFKIDLGTTPIENIFINNFFSIADGNAIKVYIYAYKLAYESTNSHIMSEEDMAKELGMSSDDVKRAFDFWKEQGVIKTEKDDENEIYSFLSIRELFLGVTDMAQSEEELPKAEESSTNKQMFIFIEDFLNTNLSPNEIERIIAHLSEFGQERELVCRCFPYCLEVAGKRNVNYVLGVLRNWALDGIKTVSDLERYLENKKKPEAKKNARKKKRNIPKDERLSSDEIENIINQKLLFDVERARGEIDE